MTKNNFVTLLDLRFKYLLKFLTLPISKASQLYEIYGIETFIVIIYCSLQLPVFSPLERLILASFYTGEHIDRDCVLQLVNSHERFKNVVYFVCNMMIPLTSYDSSQSECRIEVIPRELTKICLIDRK